MFTSLMELWLRVSATRSLRSACRNVEVDEDGPFASVDGVRVGYDLARRRWVFIATGVAPPTLTRLVPGRDGVDAATAALLQPFLTSARPVVLSLGIEAGTAVVELAAESTWAAPPRLRAHASTFATVVVPALRAALRSATSRECPTGDGGVLTATGDLLRCPACRGVVLTPTLALEHVLAPRGLGPGDVKDGAGRGGRTGACPLCATPMAPIVLDDDVVDFCRGCGAVFVDADEAAGVTHGFVSDDPPSSGR